MNFQGYGSNTQTCLFDTVSTAVTGPTHSFRNRDGPDVRAAMSLHAPFYVGSVAASYAPAASRGSATAENFKVVTYNVGAKTDLMFSSAQRAGLQGQDGQGHVVVLSGRCSLRAAWCR